MAVLSLTTNTCRCCKQELDIGQFYRIANRFGTLYADNTCKRCRTSRNTEATRNRGDAAREWRKQYKRKQRQASGCKTREQIKAEAIVRKEELEAIKPKPQHDAHVKRWRAMAKVRDRQRKARSLPKGRIDGRMKTAVAKALRGAKAGRKWEYLVGYTTADLMAHLERQFTIGMSWSNIGKWHIDHVVPKSSFKYTSTDNTEFKRCWALSNLQPLWAWDNLAKGDALPQDT